MAAAVALLAGPESASASPSGGAEGAGAAVPAEAPARGQSRSARADTLEKVAAEAAEAVVLLEVENPSGTRRGSGFIVQPDGRILTSFRVVDRARAIRVRLASGDVYERVTILATDERRGIAVLEVPGFELPRLLLGNSDSVQVGSPVVAVGSPLGLENSVSTGVVRERRSEPEGYDLLRISALAPRGSGGGPVLAANGEVVGIAVSGTEEGEEVDAAVPINYARGLLSHVEGEPVAVLPSDDPAAAPSSSSGTPDASRPDRGLAYDLRGFHGYRVEREERIGEVRRRRSRITYRRIEALGGRPRIERWAEVEVTERTGPFDTPLTVRRERSRAVVAADDLRPVSVRGEARWRDGDDWERREYSFQFEDRRVSGSIVDSDGDVREIGRELPAGTLLRSTRHLAFATLAEDSLLGRSVELTTFDALSAELGRDRYDVRDTATIRLDGESHEALRVDLASGLENATAHFRRERPRILLRLVEGYGRAVEEVVELEVFGGRDEAPDQRPDPDDDGRRGVGRKDFPTTGGTGREEIPVSRRRHRAAPGPMWLQVTRPEGVVCQGPRGYAGCARGSDRERPAMRRSRADDESRRR